MSFPETSGRRPLNLLEVLRPLRKSQDRWGVATACTLSVPIPSQESGATYTFSSSSTSVGIAPNASDPNYSVVVSPGLTGSGTITCVASVPNGCGTASSTFTITRRLAPAPTTTFTRLSTNFPAAQAGVICLRQNTQYTWQLNGLANTPPNLVTSGNLGLPTALGTWSWNATNNVMTLTTPGTTGSVTAYTVALNNVTCAGGNITAADQYRLATNTTYTFNIAPSVLNCGNFQVRATGFPISCPNALNYTWSVVPNTVAFIGSSSGCGVQNIQIDPSTVPAGGCTLSCNISNSGCTIPGGCTVCENFVVGTPNPTTFVIPNNSQTYLAGCRPGPGGDNPKRAGKTGIPPNFEVDPNPTSGILSVNLNSDENMETVVSISDVAGKQAFTSFQDTRTFTLDVSGLKQGVYLISIHNKDGLKTKRFIKN